VSFSPRRASRGGAREPSNILSPGGATSEPPLTDDAPMGLADYSRNDDHPRLARRGLNDRARRLTGFHPKGTVVIWTSLGSERHNEFAMETRDCRVAVG